jgi:hypothetical protein
MNSNDLTIEFGHNRPNNRTALARERFTPTEKSKLFLNECRKRGYDISTIINLAIDCFEPKTRDNGFTWEGIDNVVTGKKKWY